MKRVSLVLALLLANACHRDQQAQGPFERAGKHLDSAAQKTGGALKTAAEKTGEAAQMAGHATGRALGRAGDKLQGKTPQPAVTGH